MCVVVWRHHHYYFFIFAESSPSHPSVTTHSHPPALCEDTDEFTDFQGPVGAPASFPTPSSTTTPPTTSSGLAAQARAGPPPSGFSEDPDDFCDFVQGPASSFPAPHLSVGAAQSSSPSSSSSPLPVTQNSAVSTSSPSTFQGNSSFASFDPAILMNLIIWTLFYECMNTFSFFVCFFYFCRCSLVPDAEYINSYVGDFSLCRPVFQHVRMQPAQQMAWPHYLKPFKSNKTLPARQTRILGRKKTPPTSIYTSACVSGGSSSAIAASTIYRSP